MRLSKNWKSFIAFFLFIFLYGYSVLKGQDVGVIEITGFIALYAMAFMMLRGETLNKVAESLTEVIKKKIGG